MKDSIFIAKDVVKQYGDFTALNKVSISVPKGSIYGLLGPNGAGKTTLMRIINQITAPDSGDLIFDGQPLQHHHISEIGYLPEERGLYKKMKVGEQALYLAQLKGMTYPEALEKLKFWFTKLDILDWWNKKVEELSKGMAQKIQFVVTVIHQPKLLIFDEPFSGFDPINANLIKDEILNLRNEGATVIFSTHRMESVDELCDNLAMINKSKKILSGKINDIKSAYKSDIYKIKHLNKIDDKITNFSVIDSKIVFDNIYESEIKLTKKISSNNLLRLLLSNSIEILEFKQKTPNMNDIFIMKVEEGNNNG